MHPRAQISKTKEESSQQQQQQQQGRQATTDGLHSGAAAETQERVPDQPLPDGAEEAESGHRAGPQRVPDQDLVPEQAGQDQEGQRHQEHASPPPDGAGIVQPRHHHHQGRQVRQRLIGRDLMKPTMQ